MGEAREAMDRVTAAANARDATAVGDCYAADAVVVTPDQGEVRGREAIVTYMLQFHDAFPDASYEYAGKLGQNGVITRHRIYFSPNEFAEQLGLG